MNVERSCTAVLMLQCQQLHRVCRGALFEGGERSVPQRDASSLLGQTITRCLTEGCVAAKEHLWGWFLRGGHEKRSEEIGLVFPSVWVLHFSSPVRNVSVGKQHAGTARSCWSWGGPAAGGAASLYARANSDFTVFIFLLEAGTRCSAVRLLGCCSQGPGSIHINVVLFHTVISAVFITPETCTGACKGIKC